MKVVALLALASHVLAAPAVVTVWQTATIVQSVPTVAAAPVATTQAAAVAAAVVTPTITITATANAIAETATAAATTAATAATSDASTLDSLLDKLLAYFGIGSSQASTSAAAITPVTTATTPVTTVAKAITTSTTPAVVYVPSSSAAAYVYKAPESSTVVVKASSSAQAAAPSASSSVASSDIYAQIYSSSGIDTTFAKNILDTHNQYRSDHSVGPLSWDLATYNYAKAYADKYDCSGVLTHSGGKYGENLAAGFSTGSAATDAWYSEGATYDYTSANTYDHFTQLVWKSTTKVGCAYKDCTAENWGLYVICSYDPAGNVIGYDAANVLP